MTKRLMILAGLLVVSACGSMTSASEETTTTSVVSTTTSTTTSTTSTSTTTTTTLAPIQISGEFADVAEAALLGPLPENFALGAKAASKSPLYDNSCHASTAAIDPVICEFGDLQSDVVIVFTGDSHAAQWFGAFEVAARTNHWKLVSMT